MVFDKIQNELMKKAVKRDTMIKKDFKYRYGYYKDNVAVTNEPATALYLIPKDKFYLDIGKVFNQPELTNVDKLLADNECDELTLTTELVLKEKGILNVFKNGDEKIYVNKKLLDTFKGESFTYKGSKRNAPVYIYVDNKMVGLILPVNYHEVI